MKKLGSAQCKSAIMFAALKTPGTTLLKQKNQEIILKFYLKYLKLPIKNIKKKNFDFIEIKGLKILKLLIIMFQEILVQVLFL